MRISIVTAYYNRKKLFYETLKSINKSKFKDFELIVVDDCSSPENRLECYLKEFSFLRIIRLERENKWYINPCIPFNIGIRDVKGEVILLQNPECIHVHDVLTYVNENISDLNYLSMAAYGLSEELTPSIPEHNNNNSLVELFKTLPQQTYMGGNKNGWYNHSKYRPASFHFCTAITKKNMNLLGGFDERYAYGICRDDVEFIDRVKRLKLNIIMNDNIGVIHQYHPTVTYNLPNANELQEKNLKIYKYITMLETKINVN